jgi:hypothetical protein
MSNLQIKEKCTEIYDSIATHHETETEDEWVQSILENTEKYHYLEGKTKTDLQKEIERILGQIPFLSISEKQIYMTRLKEYRYIDEIPDFVIGRHIRWIKKPMIDEILMTTTYSPEQKPVLTNGGILTDIKFLENGVYLLCKTYGSNKKQIFHQYKMEDTYSFQKISPEEWILLMANELSLNK